MSESFVQANCVDNSAYTSSSGGNRGKTARFWPHSPGKTRRITILFQFPVPLLLTPQCLRSGPRGRGGHGSTVDDDGCEEFRPGRAGGSLAAALLGAGPTPGDPAHHQVAREQDQPRPVDAGQERDQATEAEPQAYTRRE